MALLKEYFLPQIKPHVAVAFAKRIWWIGSWLATCGKARESILVPPHPSEDRAMSKDEASPHAAFSVFLNHFSP